MRIAVVQRAVLDADGRDAALSSDAVSSALENGADIVVMPLEFPSPHGGSSPAALMAPEGAGPVWRGESLLGDTVQLTGDACIDPIVLEQLGASPPDALIVRPGAESDLQAEAFIEHALALSLSVCGLVITCERIPSGGGGRGWSALLYLGEVLAETEDVDDVIFADFEMPLSAPDPREPIPVASAILRQRLALHRGERPDVGYLADLS